ncbi:MAG: hypothetical protein V7664_13730 [Qipengyuania sp.]|uniref:hypothetical protein n=1 Tax=Qipengyuania sp. TaxID=2004515 RepID=UPI0030033AE1
MSARAQSLRELRAKRPLNVEILPSATNRRVEQECNRSMRDAADKLREQHAHRFGYIQPGIREQMEAASFLVGSEKTPALELAFAMLFALTDDQYEEVIRLLSRQTISTTAQQALAIAKLRNLTVGEQVSLDAAIDIVSGRKKC